MDSVTFDRGLNSKDFLYFDGKYDITAFESLVDADERPRFLDGIGQQE